MKYHISAIVVFACFWQGTAVATVKLGYLYLQSGPTVDKQSDSWVQETFAQFKLAVQHVNADPAVLPGHTLTYDVFDTEGKMLKALNGASDMTMLQDGSIVGVIGTGYSSAAEYAAGYCSFRKVPMVSPGSTFIPLVDKSNYPYFLRSIANDVDLTRAQLAFIREMGWTDISVVLDFEDNQAMLKRVIEPTAALLGISLHIVSLPRTDSPDYTSDMMDAAVQAIVAAERNVVLARFRSKDGAEIWRAVQKYNCHGAGRVWLTDHNQFDTPALSNWTNCIVAHRPEATNNPVKDKYINDWAGSTVLWNASIHGFFNPVTKAPFYNDPWDTTVFDTDYSNHGDGQPDSWGMYAYDTVWLFADALGKMIAQGEDLSRGDLLRTHLLASNRLGITGQIMFDQETQDRMDDVVLSHTSVINGKGVRTIIRKATKALGLEVGEDWCRDKGCLTRLAEPLWSPDPMLSNVVPLARPLECAVGFAYDGVRAQCAECPFGFHAPVAGMRACLPCLPGSYQDETGARRCTSCSPGTFAAEGGSTSCDACPPGYFQREQAQAVCLPCAPGTIADQAGSSKCLPCEVGSYADMTGSLVCTPCEGAFTTSFRGAEHAGECTCPKGTQWNRRDDRCDECQSGAFCNGGLALPLVQAGMFGRYGGSTAEPELRAQELAKLEGRYAEYRREQGSAALFDRLQVWKCASGVECPRDDELVIPAELSGRDEIRVADLDLGIGVRRPGDCPPGREDIACAVCEENRFGPECAPCDDHSALAIILSGLLILVLVMLLVGQWYRGCDYEPKADVYFMVAAMGGLVIFYGQCVGILSNMAIDWQPAVQELMETSGTIFLIDLRGGITMCVIGTSFIVQYYEAFCVPLLLVVSMLGAMGMSRALPSVRGHDFAIRWECSFNVLGSLFAAFYVFMVQNTTAFFECVPNPVPEARPTLAKYKQIECGSDRHAQATAPMVLGMLLYAVGFFTLCIVLTIVAPRHFHSSSFRECVYFLVYRWKPARWYFNVAYMLRNVLAACVNSMSEDGGTQLVLMGCVLLSFTFMMCLTKPWKSQTLCYVDALSSFMLIVLLFFGSNALFCGEKIQNLLLSGDHARALEWEEFINRFTSGMVYINVLTGVGIAVLLGQMANELRPSVQSRQHEREQLELKDLSQVFEDMCAHSGFDAALKHTVEFANTEDTAGMRAFVGSVVHRLGDEHLTKRLRSAKRISVGPMQAEVMHLTRKRESMIEYNRERVRSAIASRCVPPHIPIKKASVVPAGCFADLGDVHEDDDGRWDGSMVTKDMKTMKTMKMIDGREVHEDDDDRWDGSMVTKDMKTMKTTKTMEGVS